MCEVKSSPCSQFGCKIVLTCASPLLGLPALRGKTTSLDRYSLSLSTFRFWPSSDLERLRWSTTIPRPFACFLGTPASLSSERVNPRPSDR
jgi:hypothetical protein